MNRVWYWKRQLKSEWHWRWMLGGFYHVNRVDSKLNRSDESRFSTQEENNKTIYQVIRVETNAQGINKRIMSIFFYKRSCRLKILDWLCFGKSKINMVCTLMCQNLFYKYMLHQILNTITTENDISLFWPLCPSLASSF